MEEKKKERVNLIKIDSSSAYQERRFFFLIASKVHEIDGIKESVKTNAFKLKENFEVNMLGSK